MKKISLLSFLLAGMLTFSACDSDRDSNPTLLTPKEFTLNTPVVEAGLIDLSRTESIPLSWSQPQYTEDNAPVVATYSVQISPNGTFTTEFDAAADDNSGADFVTLDETTTDCQTIVAGANIAKALQQLCDWEEGVTLDKLAMSLRLKSAVLDAGMNEYGVVYSNVVSLNVLPYYVELKDADPLWWHLIGGDISDGSWGSEVPVSVFPMQPQKDYDFDKKTGEGELTWTGYLAGNGFKLKRTLDGWDDQWGAGDAGYVENDGGSANITMNPGYYTVTLNTASHTLSVEAYTETLPYNGQAYVTGSFNGWSAENPMTAVHTVAGENNHDWYATLTLEAGAEVKFYDGDSWSFNIGGALNKLSDGAYGYGTQGGDNIVIEEAGTYLVIFNDITGYYRFILQ